MNNKNKSLADKIPKRVWLLISFAVAMLFWYILSIIPSTSRAFHGYIIQFDFSCSRLCAWFCNRTSGCNPYGMV